MEVFSLEDDECLELFITQSSFQSGDNNNSSKSNGIISDEMDFQSPCFSLVNGGNSAVPHYSDISDDDFVDLPSSQPPPQTSNNEDR